MNDLDRALSQIADIRAHLAASTRFRGIAPELSLLGGVLAFAAAIGQTLWPHLLGYDARSYIVVWAAVMIASTALVAAEAVARERRLHGPMAQAMLGAALRTGLPFAAAGIVITSVICTFSPHNVWMLPGIWQILVGLVGFSSLSLMPRAIVWAAWWYFLCGSVVLGLGGWSESLSPWMMGIPFGVGQTLVAVILQRAGGESQDRAA